MKKIIAMLLSLSLVFGITSPAYADEVSQKIKITEKQALEEINSGKADISFEIRDISSYTAEEIAQDAGLRALFAQGGGVGTNSVNTNYVNGKVYTTTVVFTTGEMAVYRSYPTAEIVAVDVGTASSADLYTTFSVVESTTVNGMVMPWDNYIRFKNIKVQMGCGNNTVFTQNAYAEGNLTPSIPISDIVAIFGWVTNALGYSTVAQIL